MKAHISWILFFFIMLSLIPVLYINGLNSFAKIFGIVLLLVFSVAIRTWLIKLNKSRKFAQSLPLNLNEKHFLFETFPILKRKDRSKSKILFERMAKIRAIIHFKIERDIPDFDQAVLVAVFYLSLYFKTEDFSNINNRIVLLTNDVDPSVVHNDAKNILFMNPKLIVQSLNSINLIDENECSLIKSSELNKFIQKK